MYIRKKTFILIITYLAAAVVALGAYTAVHFGMEGSYRRTAEYGYAHAFEEVGAFGFAASCLICKRRGAVGSIVCGYLRELPGGRDDHGGAAVFNAGAGADGGVYRNCRRLCARQSANLGAVGL